LESEVKVALSVMGCLVAVLVYPACSYTLKRLICPFLLFIQRSWLLSKKTFLPIRFRLSVYSVSIKSLQHYPVLVPTLRKACRTSTLRSFKGKVQYVCSCKTLFKNRLYVTKSQPVLSCHFDKI